MNYFINYNEIVCNLKLRVLKKTSNDKYLSLVDNVILVQQLTRKTQAQMYNKEAGTIHDFFKGVIKIDSILRDLKTELHINKDVI